MFYPTKKYVIFKKSDAEYEIKYTTIIGEFENYMIDKDHIYPKEMGFCSQELAQEYLDQLTGDK